MPSGNHQHQDFPIPDLTENAVIADAISPYPCKIRLKSFSETAGIAIASDSLIEGGDDVSLSLFAEFAEFL